MEKDFEKSDAEIETHESTEELKNPQEYKDEGFIILDDLNEKEKNDPRVQAFFKQFRLNNLSFFTIRQDCYQLPGRTIRANGIIYSNQTITERFIISIKIKQVWI